MKKFLSLTTILIPLLVASAANASTYENKPFVGASVNTINVNSTFKEGSEKFEDVGGSKTDFGGSINAGYKAYFGQNGNNSFFVTPEFTWNFTSIEKRNTKSGVSFSTFNFFSFNSYNVKPKFALDVAFGYEMNQKNSVFAGLGLQYNKYTYKAGVTGDLFSFYFSEASNKIKARIFAGYEYNLNQNVSFNTKLAMSYMEPIISYNFKAETTMIDLGLGVKYNF